MAGTRTKARSCEGKQRFTSRTAAAQGVESLISAGRAYPGQMQVYPCRHCGGHHFGHRERGRR